MDIINFPKVIAKFDEALSRGLCAGVGSRDGQMCIEAAICYALDLPHSDDPLCVTSSVRSFKISLNDSNKWKSAESRAKHLRDLGIAQIGSKGVVDSNEFSKLLAEKAIKVLIPQLFRSLYPNKYVKLVNACETEGTAAAARKLADATYAAAGAANTAAYGAANTAAYAAAAAAAAAANTAAYAAYDKKQDPEKYLILAANLALEVLKELKSPGCAWI